MFEERHCTLCGPGVPKRVKFPSTLQGTLLDSKIFSARRNPDRIHHRIVECTQCKMWYSDPALVEESLPDFYNQSTVTYQELFPHIVESYIPILKRALEKTSRRSVFLEIGGGPGLLIPFGVEAGFAKCIEIEPSRHAKSLFQPLPNTEFITAPFRDGLIAENSVSVVVFGQVLDHIANPSAFLKSVFRILQPGGVAVAITHNTKSISSRILGRKSPILDVEHTYLFNQKNLAQLFKKVGFSSVEAFSISNRYPIRYWVHLCPGPKPLKEKIQSLKIANKRLKLFAGNIAAIGRKPL